ncbi:MAG TPA: mechanosensitive ion channel domain-containing protein [Spirochaetia bacterium]|nr:mechanosensitive ion channel domain-containing protein [Spirochaetia bacterium]
MTRLFGILDYLELSISFLSGSFTLVFIVVPIVAALALLIGGRSLLASMLAGRSLTRIRFDSIEGEIISIDLVTTKLGCADGEIIIPNGVLSSRVLKLLTPVLRKPKEQ